MAEDYTIELGDDTEGHKKFFRFAPEGDDEWLDRILDLKPGSAEIRLRAAGEDEDDTEGHRGRSSLALRVIVESGDDDTEGHAISIHFPSKDEADAFRKRLLVTGVLVGSVALGAGAGIGLSSLAGDDAGTAGAAQSTTTGSAWTQDERAGLGAAAASTTTGSAWTQDERVGLDAAAAASSTTTGSAWTQDERPGAAGAASEASESDADDAAPLGGIQPR